MSLALRFYFWDDWDGVPTTTATVSAPPPPARGGVPAYQRVNIWEEIERRKALLRKRRQSLSVAAVAILSRRKVGKPPAISTLPYGMLWWNIPVSCPPDLPVAVLTRLSEVAKAYNRITRKLIELDNQQYIVEILLMYG
ncbi:MAG: hypothetical protein ACRD5H_00145 [Nitrososphaerales archaeon]